jgi:hypothetical protein
VTTTSASITITPAESGGVIQGNLDGAAFATVTSPVSLTGLGNGPHTYSARQIDAAGNTGSAASISWTINSTVPAAPSIDSGPTGLTNSASASFAFSSSESGVTFETSLDGAAYAPGTSPAIYSGLAQGAHSFAVRAKNAVATVGPATTRSWSVDTIAPAAPAVSGPAGTVSSTSASISVIGAESGGTLQGSLDSAAFGTITSPVSLSALGNGAHTYSARQIDAAGNTGSATSISWTVNTSVPAAPTIDSGPSGPTSSASASFAFSSSESGVTFETSIDGAGFAAGTSPATYSGLAQGAHSFAVRAKNAVGTTGPATTRSWTVDTIGPAAPTLSGPSGTVATTTASISIAPAESGGTLQGSLDGAAFAAVTSPANLSSLGDGPHTYQARQVDAAGNNGAAASISWTVDTSVTPPQLPGAPTISAGPSGLTSSTSASFSFSSGESGVTFEVSLDGGSFAGATSPKTYSGLLQGGHTFAVRAKNAAGSGPAVTRAWTVDTVAPAAPTVTRTSPTTSPTSSTSQTIAIGGVEAGGVLQGRLDGAAFAAAGATVSLSGLAGGSHTYEARVTDAAGNVGAAASVTWTVDIVAPAAPTVTRTNPTATPTTSTTQALSVGGAEAGATLQGRLDGAAFAAVGATVNLTGLAVGSHTYQVRQIDAAGNVSAVGQVTWSVSTPTTPPPNQGNVLTYLMQLLFKLIHGFWPGS